MSIKLFPYQLEALEGLPKNVILAFDTGVGKTFSAIEHYERHNPGGRLLIVAPASKVRTGDWEEAIHDYIGFLRKDTEVISYEGMAKRWKEFHNDPTLTIIVDECHFLCNATSKRSKAFLKITQTAKQWIGLSATPLPNGWKSAETYAILTGLSRNKTEFVNRFVIFDRTRMTFPLFLGYREIPVLQRWWDMVAKPLPRTGDLILPSENIWTKATMPTKLAKVYKTALKDRTYGEELLDSPSKVFATLRQIPAPSRVDALQSIIEGTAENVIVWYNFNAERDAILAMLAKSFKGRKVYEQSGHTSSLPRRVSWEKLTGSITLVQYQSGSAAIELTYASIAVYLSPPTSYSNYEQSRGRNLRHGQEKTVIFYHIMVADSLDSHIWQIIGTKRDFSTAIMNSTLESLANN